MKNIALLTILLLFGPLMMAQEVEARSDAEAASDDTPKSDFVYGTFSSTRVLCNHSVEMLPKRTLEFIVAHKFGDILTRNSAGNITGNFNEWFGFDNLADVRIGFEYGILDNLNIGVGRCKGIDARRQVVDGYLKYRIFQQKTSGMPISLTFVSSLALTYAKASSDSTSVASFPKFLDRLTFTNQLIVARKFGDRFSIQVNAGYNHRNYVAYNDANGLFFSGIASRLKFTKNLGMIVEYNHIWNRPKSLANAGTYYYDPLSFGFEILTGGHSFVICYSNGRAMNENLFIPGTTSNWLDGKFRIGFSITRRFKL